MPHNWRDGVKRIFLHLSTFGLLGSLATFFGGWGAAAVLVTWRVYEEWLDWRQGRDTLPKALIDLASQVTPSVIIAILLIF